MCASSISCHQEALGLMEESQSGWPSPVSLLVKPSKVCLCFEAHKISSVTLKDVHPLHHIEAIFNRLSKARFITTLDLEDVFWQIPLGKVSKDKTVLKVSGRSPYQFVTAPFGLCNAPQTRQPLMNKVIFARLRLQVFVNLEEARYLSHIVANHTVSTSESRQTATAVP